MQRKLRMGVPRPVVLSELARYGLNDSALLDLDPSAELPVELQQSAVALEFTELYLDERAFWEHSGSRDYLDAYGAVLNPALLNRKCTLRIGTPTEILRERVLEPMLQERVTPMLDGTFVWRQPASASSHVLISLDLDGSAGVDWLVRKLPRTTLEPAVISVMFQHPFRSDTVRLLAMVPASTDLSGLAALGLQRGEVHCNQDVVHQIQKKVDAAGLAPLLTINAAPSVGYVLHDKAHDLMVMQGQKSDQD